jgi:surface antigen
MALAALKRIRILQTRRVVVAWCLAIISLGLVATDSLAYQKSRISSLTTVMEAADNRIDVHVRVVTGIPRAKCRGSARLERGRSVRLPSLTTGPAKGGQWHWLVGDATPSGKLKVRVTCVIQDYSVTKTDIVSQRDGPYRNRRYRSFVKPRSLRTEPYTPPRKSGDGGDGASGVPLYTVGQCTWYVSRRRPDLPYFPGKAGDARNWISAAARRGIHTGDRPAVGAVAVFDYGQYGAGIYGHVAYVVAVDRDRIKIAEANFRGRKAGSTRWIEWLALKFIYRGAPPALVAPAVPNLTVPSVAPTPAAVVPEAAPAQRNRAPVVHLINVPAVVEISGDRRICAEVGDPDDDVLTTSFAADRGTVTPAALASDNVFCTRYRAPSSGGNDTIAATVSDGAVTRRVENSIPIASLRLFAQPSEPMVMVGSSFRGLAFLDKAPTDAPEPTGNVTFRLYSDSTCSGASEFPPSSAPLVDGTTATSEGFASTVENVYWIVATYEGDANYRPLARSSITVTSTPPSPPPPALVLPVSEVRSGTAKAVGPTGCVTTNFNVQVYGRQIHKVVFYLDGKKIKTLTRPNMGTRFALPVRPNSLRRGTHRVLAVSYFTKASGTKSRTLRVVFQRCGRAAAAPRFTG